MDNIKHKGNLKMAKKEVVKKAEEVAEAAGAKLFTLINNSARAYLTSKGYLRPGDSLEFGEAEAARLMDYHGVVDAATFIPNVKINEDIKAENVKLKARVAELEAELKDKE